MGSVGASLGSPMGMPPATTADPSAGQFIDQSNGNMQWQVPAQNYGNGPDPRVANESPAVMGGFAAAASAAMAGQRQAQANMLPEVSASERAKANWRLGARKQAFMEKMQSLQGETFTDTVGNVGNAAAQGIRSAGALAQQGLERMGVDVEGAKKRMSENWQRAKNVAGEHVANAKKKVSDAVSSGLGWLGGKVSGFFSSAASAVSNAASGAAKAGLKTMGFKNGRFLEKFCTKHSSERWHFRHDQLRSKIKCREQESDPKKFYNIFSCSR
jgi:hypothetical protein